MIHGDVQFTGLVLELFGRDDGFRLQSDTDDDDVRCHADYRTGQNLAIRRERHLVADVDNI